MTTIEKLREVLIVLTQKITPAHYEDCAYWDDPDGQEDSCDCGQQAALKEGLQALAELDKLKPLSDEQIGLEGIASICGGKSSQYIDGYFDGYYNGVRSAEKRLLGEV